MRTKKEIRSQDEIEAKLDNMMMKMDKVEDQMYHWRRFPEEALEKIRNDYHWLEGTIEMLEWVLGEDEDIKTKYWRWRKSIEPLIDQ